MIDGIQGGDFLAAQERLKKNNNLLKAKRVLNIKMSAKRARFLYLACQGDASSSPRQLRHWPL